MSSCVEKAHLDSRTNNTMTTWCEAALRRRTLIAVCTVDAVAIRLRVCETHSGNPHVLCRLSVHTNCIESAALHTCTNRSSPTITYWHNTTLHSAVQCTTVQYSSALHCAAPYCAVLCSTVQCCAAQQCTALWCTALHCAVQHSTVQCSAALQCTALHCAVQYSAGSHSVKPTTSALINTHRYLVLASVSHSYVHTVLISYLHISICTHNLLLLRNSVTHQLCVCSILGMPIQ